MTNVFDYLTWRGDLTFSQDPFNEVDGLVLTRFSYLPFESVKDRIILGGITVRDACREILQVPDIEEKVLLKDDVDLLEGLYTNRRFGDLVIADYENFIEPKSETQFCAVTMRMCPDLSFVAFRGTDDTLVGWKEDFNMAFTTPVPAQTLAVAYLSRMARKFPGKLLVGGHSKGGNLAVYSSACCSPEIQNRIVQIYNFDGPGFTESVLTSYGYLRACDRIRTYVPQSSVVGMLLGHQEVHTVIHSSQPVILLQHDIYTWDVTGNHFVYEDDVSDSSRLIDATVKSWLLSCSREQREKFIDAVYAIFSETKAVSFRDMKENWISNAVTIAKAVRDLDEDTKKVLLSTLASLMRCTKEELTATFRLKGWIKSRDEE